MSFHISFFVLISLTFPLFCFSQCLQQNYSYWEHDYFDSNTNEKIPSKCDCDYIKETLLLNSDSTFDLTIQKGRTSPEYSKVNGKWELTNDSLLSLSGKYYDGMYFNSSWSESFRVRYHFLGDGKTIQYTELYDGYRLWNGSGEMLSVKKNKKQK